MQIKSASEFFSGTVTLPDALNFEAYLAWEEAIYAIEAYIKQRGKDKLSMIRYTHFFIPAICQIVTGWEIANFPAEVVPDKFPVRPLPQVVILLGQIIAEITRMVEELKNLPNV